MESGLNQRDRAMAGFSRDPSNGKPSKKIYCRGFQTPKPPTPQVGAGVGARAAVGSQFDPQCHRTCEHTQGERRPPPPHIINKHTRTPNITYIPFCVTNALSETVLLASCEAPIIVFISQMIKICVTERYVDKGERRAPHNHKSSINAHVDRTSHITYITYHTHQP